jgi:hypothetical protein
MEETVPCQTNVSPIAGSCSSSAAAPAVLVWFFSPSLDDCAEMSCIIFPLTTKDIAKNIVKIGIIENKVIFSTFIISIEFFFDINILFSLFLLENNGQMNAWNRTLIQENFFLILFIV